MFTLWIGIGVLAILVVLGIIWTYRKWGHHLPKADKLKERLKKMPEHTLDYALLTLVVLFLALAFWKSGLVPAIFTWWWILVPLVIICAASTILIKEVEENKRSWIEWGALLAAVVLLAVASTNWRTHTTRQWAGGPPVSASCGGPRFVHHYGTEPGFPVNKDGGCTVALWHGGHCIWVRRAGFSAKLGPFCDKTGIRAEGNKPPQRIPSDVEYAWSADSAFDDYAQRLSPRYRFSSR